MAYKKRYNGKKLYKRNKKRKIPSDKKAAYWVGVGLSAAREADLRSKLLESKKYKSSIIAGYSADNYRNIGKKFI